MTRRDRPVAHLSKPKVDLEKVLCAATAKHRERLRNAFGLWYHIVVEELEFLSAESGSGEEETSSAVTDLEASMRRFTVSHLGPFYGEKRENLKVLGDVDEIEEMEDPGEPHLAEIKKVYVKEHAKLVNECARAHTQLMQTCSIRLLVTSLRQVSLRAQRDSLDSLKVSMLQGIISGKQQAVNTYQMEGDEVHPMVDPANNLRVARGTLGPFRPTVGGRLSVTPLNAMLMERFYSRNGTNMANLVTSPQLVQSFLSYAKGLEGNAQRTRQWAARLLFRLSASACRKSLFAGFQSLDAGCPALAVVQLEGIAIESCKREIGALETSDLEDETDEGRPQAPGIVAYTALAGGLVRLGSEVKAAVPQAPPLTLNTVPPALHLSGLPQLAVPTAPQLSIPQAPGLLLPLSTSLNVPKAPSLPLLTGNLAAPPQAPALSLPTAPILSIPQGPKLPVVPQAPTLSIPLAPSLSIPPAPLLGAIPRAPSLGIPLAPSLGNIPSATSIPAAPPLGMLSTLPQAPPLSASLNKVPTAPPLAIPTANLPTAPLLSIPVAPGIRPLPSIPQAPSLGIPLAPSLSVPAAPLLSGLPSAGSIPLVPSLVVPKAPILGSPPAPSLSIPAAPLLGGSPRAPALSLDKAVGPAVPLLAPVLSGVSQAQSLQKSSQPLPAIPPDLVTKKFHWDPLPKYKLAKTVWLQPSEDVDVDFPSLLSLFAEKAKVKEEAKAPAKVVVMVLEQKKVNNVGILQSSEC